MPFWFSKILFHKENNNACDQCGQKFKKYDELIAHARHVHHHHSWVEGLESLDRTT
jgi:hypothetical protein